MSLESLTPEEKKALQEAQNAQRLLRDLLNDPDRETSLAAKRLLKKKDPSLRFPDLEAAEAAAVETAAAQKKLDEARAELAAYKQEGKRQDEDKRIREAGYDPEKVRKIADEKGIADLDLVVQLLQAKDALAEPSNPSFQPIAQPDLKELWANPDGWLHDKIEEVHQEFRGKKANPLASFG